jgi:hypothetical protein
METLHYMIWPSVTFLVTWLGLGCSFAFLDMFQPEWYRKKYVGNPKWYRSMEVTEFINLLKCNFQNLQIMFFCFFTCVYLRNRIFNSDSLFLYFFQSTFVGPGIWIWRIMFETTGATIWGEVWFFIVHRIAHLPQMRHWHAKHHEYSQISFALVGLYCSWQEIVFVNFPLGLGWAILIKMDPIILSVWLLFAAIHILTNHNSTIVFTLPFDNAIYHLEHHRSRLDHFGASWIYSLTQFFGMKHHRVPMFSSCK